jgi:CheY-like chemotaxis protein
MTKNFLLIDDDQDDRELFCEAIEAIDKQIICYGETSGLKALEKLNSNKIQNLDVIFLDVNMPVMDGWQCLSILKSTEVCKSIPVIMYSTSYQPEDIEKAQHMGAVCFFTKPTDFQSLKKSLGIVVNHVKTGSLQALQAGSPLLTNSSP